MTVFVDHPASPRGETRGSFYFVVKIIGGRDDALPAAHWKKTTDTGLQK